VSDAGQGGAAQQVVLVLRELFGQLVDPRAPKGIPQELAIVLTVTVLPVLVGAGNFREAGDRAAKLPEGPRAGASQVRALWGKPVP
jgi:hypothetical protein